MEELDSPGSIGDGSRDISDTERVLLRYEVSKALPDEFGEVLVLSHESADDVFTENRREIIQTLASGEIESIHDLAKAVDRDYGNVSRDLDILSKHDIIEIVESGRAKQPVLAHDSILVEPLVAPASVGSRPE